MKKNTSRQTRNRLPSLEAGQLAKVSGGASLGSDLLILGGCFPPEPVPEPYPFPLPSPFPIPVW